MSAQQIFGERVRAAAKRLHGAVLQSLWIEKPRVIFGFWQNELIWLVLDFTASSPAFFLIPATLVPRIPSQRKSQKLPLGLFVSAHGLKKQVKGVRFDPANGRILELRLDGEESDLVLEARLFPHGQNLLAHWGSKRISLFKPKELTRVSDIAEDLFREDAEVWGEWLDAGTGYWQRLFSAASQKISSPQKDTNRILGNKKRAVQRMRQDIQEKESLPWFEVGETLKSDGLAAAVQLWPQYIELREDLAGNIERCFSKAKDIRRKIEVAKRRLAELENEVARIQAQGPPCAPKLERPLLRDGEARGRKRELAPGVYAYVGKSAEDNLTILRRARPWDLWLHLRDFPGAHGILQVPKAWQPDDSALLRAAKWVAGESLGAKRCSEIGRLALNVAECRNVRALKGSQKGRVLVQNSRELWVSFGDDEKSRVDG